MVKIFAIFLMLICSYGYGMNSSDSTLKKTKRFGIEIIPSDIIIGDVSIGVNYSLGESVQFRLSGSYGLFGELNWKGKLNFNTVYSLPPIKNRYLIAGIGVDLGFLNLQKNDKVCTYIDRDWRPGLWSCSVYRVQVLYRTIAPQIFLGARINIGKHMVLLGNGGFKYYFLERIEKYPHDNFFSPFGQLAIQFKF